MFNPRKTGAACGFFTGNNLSPSSPAEIMRSSLYGYEVTMRSVENRAFGRM